MQRIWYMFIGFLLGILIPVPLMIKNIHVCEKGIRIDSLNHVLQPVNKSGKADEIEKTFVREFSSIHGDSVDFSSEQFLEPLVQGDFPTTSSEPIIPHIIHQTYKSVDIPVQLEKYVQSIVAKNPDWTYYFWTDESANRFVAEKYPHLLQVWNNYKVPINRADAIRYIILYEFGGFYGDLDVEVKRPLDDLTKKYSCIFPTEPFEQSVFRLGIPYLLTNAIMMCRPKHPFLKQMIDTLHQFSPMCEQLDKAGPSFVTSQFIRYNNITADEIYKFKQFNESNSPYFYKGSLPEDDYDAVYIPNTQYFINSLSQKWMNEKDYKKICDRKGEKTTIVTKACNELNRRLAQTNRDQFAYTDHHWFESYHRPVSQLRTTVRIDKIVKEPTIY